MSTRALNGLAAISIDELRPSPGNPRERLTDIDELAVSIRENGLIQPLVVQKVPGFDGYQIVAGHRRFAAVLRLGWSTCPCVIRRDMLPDEELLAMLVENGQRAGLDPIEEARALRRLKTAGMTDIEVARKIGRSVDYARRRLMLLQLPPDEQDALRAGHYSITHAEGLVRSATAQQRQRDAVAAGKVAPRPVGRPKGAKTKPYFGETHALAKAARARCNHRGSPKVGYVACGSCWEAVIREDERAQANAYSTGYAADAREGVAS